MRLAAETSQDTWIALESKLMVVAGILGLLNRLYDGWVFYGKRFGRHMHRYAPLSLLFLIPAFYFSSQDIFSANSTDLKLP